MLRDRFALLVGLALAAGGQAAASELLPPPAAPTRAVAAAAAEEMDLMPIAEGDGLAQPFTDDVWWDESGGGAYGDCPPVGRMGHFMADAEALLWWAQGMRIPPLLTTSPNNVTQQNAGVLGPNFNQTLTTQILVGNERINKDMMAGGRFTAGYWADDCETTGILGNFFVLNGKNFDYTASSNGNPILARPFFNVQPQTGSPRQDSSLIAFPNVWTGDIAIAASIDVLGAEAYLSENILRCYGHRLDFVYGYRFFKVNESLTINDQIVANDPNGPIVIGTTITSFDQFTTKNNFNGGQIGLLWEYKEGRWSWEAGVKLALGSVNESVNINGAATTTVPGGASASTVGGLLALPSNIGSYNHSQFALIQETQVGVGYQVTSSLRATVAYNLIYLTHMVRPGDQVDLLVNPTQINSGTLVGAARPQFEFKDTDFWLQGVNLGLEYRW
ncbi:MAG: BBP7 family outer membrane beta-barrel protein [Pirellulales bacterium]